MVRDINQKKGSVDRENVVPIDHLRVQTTKAVGKAWRKTVKEREDLIRKSFSRVGLSLPLLDGTQDTEINFVGHKNTLNYGIDVQEVLRE